MTPYPSSLCHPEPQTLPRAVAETTEARMEGRCLSLAELCLAEAHQLVSQAPGPPTMVLFGNRVTAGVINQEGPGEVPTACDACPCPKEKLGHRDAHGESEDAGRGPVRLHQAKEQVGSRPQAWEPGRERTLPHTTQKGPTLLAPWSWTLSSRNSCCGSHSACGTLLRQPLQANAYSSCVKV